MSADPQQRFVGGLLAGAGALITLLSGLCTVAYGYSELTAPPRLPNGVVALFTGPGMLVFAIPFGGLPIFFGLLVLAHGLEVGSLARPRTSRRLLGSGCLGIGMILSLLGAFVVYAAILDVPLEFRISRGLGEAIFRLLPGAILCAALLAGGVSLVVRGWKLLRTPAGAVAALDGPAHRQPPDTLGDPPLSSRPERSGEPGPRRPR